MDANRIAGNLWVGSAPQPSASLHKKFDMVVLCAEEYQPRSHNFPGVKIVHAPFDDSQELSTRERNIVSGAAQIVRAALDQNMRVLVTCHMGLNRSALVASLALMMPGAGPTPSCMSGRSTVRLMREKRHPNALMNAHFRRIVEGVRFCRSRP